MKLNLNDCFYCCRNNFAVLKLNLTDLSCVTLMSFRFCPNVFKYFPIKTKQNIFLWFWAFCSHKNTVLGHCTGGFLDLFFFNTMRMCLRQKWQTTVLFECWNCFRLFVWKDIQYIVRWGCGFERWWKYWVEKISLYLWTKPQAEVSTHNSTHPYCKT